MSPTLVFVAATVVSQLDALQSAPSRAVGRPVAGAPLATWMFGDSGPLVVAVHGLAESSRYWTGVVDRLATSHRVVVIDLLGFGRSPWPDLGYSAESHATTVAAAVRFAVGDEPALWLGHQAGVTIAMHHATRRPESVTGIVGLGTPWYRSDLEARRSLRGNWWLSRWLVEHESRARILCRTLCGGRPGVPYIAGRVFATETMPSAVVEDVFLHHWTSLSETLRTCWIEARLPDHFASLPVPLFALHGDDDLAVPVENLIDAAAARSWLSIERVSDGAFNLALDAPDTVAEVVAELAAERRPGPGHPRPLITTAEIDVADAAALARTHRRTVLSWIESGSVVARAEGNRLLVDRGSLVAHLFDDDVDPESMLRLAWLSTADVGARLGVSPSTVQRLRADDLPSHRVGSRRVHLADEVDAWWASRHAVQ